MFICKFLTSFVNGKICRISFTVTVNSLLIIGGFKLYIFFKTLTNIPLDDVGGFGYILLYLKGFIFIYVDQT